MAYGQRRGKYWHARWRREDGTWGSRSRNDAGERFLTEKAAEDWGNEQEADIRRGLWKDPERGSITLAEWVEIWGPGQDLGLKSRDNYKYLIEAHILPAFGHLPIGAITASKVAAWEQDLISRYERGGVPTSARTRLATILGDAVVDQRIDYNPALRQRRRGRRTGVGTAGRSAEKAYTSALDTIMIAERLAILAGRQDEFVQGVLFGFGGLRWAEVIGLQPPYVRPGLIRVDWQLVEHRGRFFLGPPKDDSHRDIDLPPFLDDLMARHMETAGDRRCVCKPYRIEGQKEQPCQGGERWVFLGPDQGHVRNSNFARRLMDPAADGGYPEEKGNVRPRPARPVMVDLGKEAAGWPGRIWRPSWKALPRAVEVDLAECPACMGTQAVHSGMFARHKETGGRTCPGSDERLDVWDIPFEPPLRGRGIKRYDPADSRVSLASWLPIRRGLTPHGMRHGHKTLMAELEIAEVLQADRMGHAVPGMRGVYTHVTLGMREMLHERLQEAWEIALAERWAISPRSPVPLLDDLLRVGAKCSRKILEQRKSVAQKSRKTKKRPSQMISG